ncbi:MAG: ATP-binding protein [Candidatus Omnitrophota bacterium]
MLISFSLGNFLSFKDKVTFSMVATSRKEHEDQNVFKVNKKLKLLKSAVIYGANASGKSNLLKAMTFVRNFILTSSKETLSGQKINVQNFKLDTSCANRPSFFEVNFVCEDICYRYGFEADRDRVHKEWLYFVPNIKELLLFERNGEKYEIGPKFLKEAKGLTEKTRNNALFLSVVAQFNGEISKKICGWFYRFRTLFGKETDTIVMDFTLNKLEEDGYKEEILKFLKIADLGIEDISGKRVEVDTNSIPQDLRDMILKSNEHLLRREIRTTHSKYDSNSGEKIPELFNLETEESEGTIKLFSISGPIIHTIKSGDVLLFDEFVSNLHPMLAISIIKMFNSVAGNPNNAQLIFDSHDTILLDRSILRRDQIWFIEKDEKGTSNLFSLVEYKVRNTASFAKDYMLGKYGATPFIKEYNCLEE